MKTINTKLFFLTIFVISLWPNVIRAQSSNAPVFEPATNEIYHYDPVAENKERVKRFHEMVLVQRNLSPIWYKTDGKILTKREARKLLIRPSGIDDEGWELLQLMLELVLAGNQPVQFYARVVDQNGAPIAGASLDLHFSGIDTDKVLAKYPHMDMGEEQTNWTAKVYSDANGWVRLDGIAGHYLYVWSISKAGYLSRYQDDIAGGMTYETNAVTRLGYVRASGELTMDAVNPKKGYTFSLTKTNETTRVK